MSSRWVGEAAAAGMTRRAELGRQWDIMGQLMTHLFLSWTQTHKWNCLLSQRERVFTEHSKKNMLNMLIMRAQPERKLHLLLPVMPVATCLTRIQVKSNVTLCASFCTPLHIIHLIHLSFHQNCVNYTLHFKTAFQVLSLIASFLVMVFLSACLNGEAMERESW